MKRELHIVLCTSNNVLTRELHLFIIPLIISRSFSYYVFRATRAVRFECAGAIVTASKIKSAYNRSIKEFMKREIVMQLIYKRAALPAVCRGTRAKTSTRPYS